MTVGMLAFVSIMSLIGCSTVKETWDANKGQIIQAVVEQLEKEKVEGRVIDKIIEKLNDIAPVDSTE
jgi:hypothetical protein